MWVNGKWDPDFKNPRDVKRTCSRCKRDYWIRDEPMTLARTASPNWICNYDRECIPPPKVESSEKIDKLEEEKQKKN